MPGLKRCSMIKTSFHVESQQAPGILTHLSKVGQWYHDCSVIYRQDWQEFVALLGTVGSHVSGIKDQGSSIHCYSMAISRRPNRGEKTDRRSRA